MKITAISDLHGLLPNLEPCDVVLICGDILPLNIQDLAVQSEMWLRGPFANWINNLQCEHVLAVWGNHDFIGRYIGKDENKYKEIIGKPTKYKIEFLEDNKCNVIVGDEQITVWGSPWCKPFGTWAYMCSEEELAEHYKSMPKGCDIVMTHEAPRIGKMGIIQQGHFKDVRAGSISLANAIKEKMPRYALSGHIHSSEHTLSKYKGAGDTLFATVSLLDEDYNNTYKPLTFDI